MKRIFLLLLVVLLTLYLPAQTIIAFHEDFELPSLDDSLSSSSIPAGGNPWAISTKLKSSGLRSDSSRVQDSKTTYLTTISFSTIGYNNVSLKFAQICKLLVQDGGFIQYSIDGGTNWQIVTNSYYRGNGVFTLLNKFSENCYGTLWKPGDTLTLPTNSWWTYEIFNMSSLISNQANVKLRFCISDGGTIGGEGRYGWLLDDIKVVASVNEIDDPKITFKTPIIKDSVTNTGPFLIKAFISDASAITSANLVYNVNGGSDNIIAMTNISDSSYIGEIPSYTYNTTISYKIIATDQYANQNISNSYSFIIKKIPLIVEIGTGLLTSSYAPISVISSTSSNLYSYNASVYKASEINATGYIKSIAWNKATTGNYNLGNASFKIYLKEVPANTNVSTTYAAYNTDITGATLVYSKLTQSITGNTGWDTYNFNVDSFAYSGQNDLMVFVEFYRPGNANAAIKYYYSPSTDKAYTFTGPIVPPALSFANYRPDIRLAIITPVFLNDAGVSLITSPTGILFTTIPIPVKVKVKNYGSSILSKTNVHWSLDSIYQGSVTWTGNMMEGLVSSEILLGNITISNGNHVVKAWTDLPNDSIDNNNMNDTVNGSFYRCPQILSGTYTVGNSASDYNTLNDALTALLNCGINGPVVFKIKPGIYQQFTIPIIPGTSAVNTITFESESGNNNDVKIIYAASNATDNWVIRIDGAEYIKIKNISVQAQGTTYGNGIELMNAASHNTIEGCKIIVPSINTSNCSGITTYSITTKEQYNTYKNNVILNGFYGINNYGPGSGEKGNIIEGNTINGFYYAGIYSYYQDSVTINSNIVENGTNAIGPTGISVNSHSNLLSISNNKVYVYSIGNSGNAGITMSNCTNHGSQPGIISNNFVSQSAISGSVYGIMSSYGIYQNFYYNSVNITSGNPSTSYNFYTNGGSNVNLLNNNLCNTGGGYAYYVNNMNPPPFVNTDYNNLYTTGTNLAYWNTNITNLSALQLASNFEAHSITANPGFISLTDLHSNSIMLNNAATPVSGVLYDIDGELRNSSTPDIGADEFQIFADDAGIISLESPVVNCSGNAIDVIVKLKNFGANILTSVSINWTLNGVNQPIVNYTGNLPNLSSTNVLLSNYTFVQGINYIIKVWVSNPNGQIDNNFVNDTLLINYITALNGSYTIGATAADYASINLAVADLILKGVCGPTVFNILPGTYNENVSIPQILGSSATNTITFQSSNGDSTSVKLIYSSAGANDNFVFKLNGADNIIIKNLTLQNNGGAFSKVVELAFSANNIRILNNIINSSVSTTNTAAGIYNASGLDNYNIYRNNIISNGYYGIYVYGASATSLEKGTIIDGNTIIGSSSFGIYSTFQDSVSITSNTVEPGSSTIMIYGIFNSYSKNTLKISNNKVNIHNPGTGINYGISVNYCDNTATQPGIIANNFVSQSGTSVPISGLYCENSTFQNYYHNSVNITSGASGNSYSFRVKNGSTIKLKNNILSNTGSGYAYYIETISAIVNSDYNNLYATGSNLAYWGGTSAANLTALQALSNKDSNSMSIDAWFINNTDLHAENPLLYHKGTPIAEISDDIDGDTRNIMTPCIGADEFLSFPNDAKVKAFYTLGKLPKIAGSPHFVKSVIFNRGLNTLYNLSVNLSISGSNTFTNTYNIDSIHPGAYDTISFSGFSPPNFGVNNVKVSVPADDLLTNNEMNFMQTVTDTVFSYADTSTSYSKIGFGTASGMMLAKFYVNGNKTIPSINVYIVDSNSIGRQVYAVILKNGVVADTSVIITITANDINTWKRFEFVNPAATTTSNNYFYAGIAQISTLYSAFYPLGIQKEFPVRKNAYYTAALNGSNLTQTTDMGRFMINANLGNPTNKDASVIGILSPNSGCGLSSELVKIVVQNKGTDTIYGGQNVLIAKYGLNLNGILINVHSQQITDTIYPAAIKNISFNVPLNVIAPFADSAYQLVAWVELANDPFTNNDTIYHSFVAKFTPLAPLSNAVTIPYGTTANLTAISSDSLFWFDNINSNTSFGQGAVFTTPHLFATDTFYVAANTGKNVLATIGTGISVNTNTSYPAPYGNSYWGAKHQILILKSELDALGITSGPLTSVAFDVATAQGSALQNFEIKMGHTPQNYMLQSAWANSITTPVYSAASYIDVIGWNTHTFTTPFIWNGIDNVVVDVCFNNSSSSYNAKTRYTSTSFISVTARTSQLTNVCTNPTAMFNSIDRPNMQIRQNVQGCISPKTPVIVTVTNTPAVDAGISQITSPVGSIPSGINTPIKALIKNYGSGNLTSAMIGWSIDGVIQTPQNWIGNLSSGQSSIPYQIATIPFIGGIHKIKVWTYNPNNIADIYAINDTATQTFSVCMNGSFTIGNGKNFPSFNAALTALDTAGICGNVVFLVDSGTYNERLLIGAIPGMGINATVTFTSATGDSTDVILHYSTSSVETWAIKFNGCSYFKFTKMKLSVIGGTNYGRVMELANAANHIEISNCIIEGIITYNADYSCALIFSDGIGLNHNTFKNNLLLNGSIGIYLNGYSGNLHSKNSIRNNIIKDFSFYGIYMNRQDSVSVISNTIENKADGGFVYALSANYTNNGIFTKNKIHLNGAAMVYGIDMNNNNLGGNNGEGNSIVGNNFVSQTYGTTFVYNVYGINNVNNKNTNYYNNSVNISGSNSASYAFYTSAGSLNNIINNIFSNKGGSYAYYAVNSTGINISNYNNLYTTGLNLAYWGSDCSNLNSFKTLSGKEQNSISVIPGFFSSTNLHLINFELNAKATPLTSVNEDIDGEIRNLTTPDIGADEFNLPANDAGITAVTAPISPVNAGNQTVKAVIRNFGSANLTAVSIQWSVNDIIQPSVVWAGNLISGDTISKVLGNFNFNGGMSNTIKVWTNLPNGMIDLWNDNDTINKDITVCSGPLTGIYTIGGGGANFSTVNSAVQSLNYCGISGPVTFNVNPGFYNEQFVINQIQGSSAANKVTFQSSNGDSSSVIIGFDYTQTGNNYVIKLDGTQYLTIKGMTIRQTNSINGNVIVFKGMSSNITIANNRLEMPLNAGGTSVAILTFNSDFGNDNKILNNYILNAYNGIVMQGSTILTAKRNVIEGNTFKSFNYYGIQADYQDSLIIRKNSFETNSTLASKRAVYLTSPTNSLFIDKNKIKMLVPGVNLNGIYIINSNGTTNSRQFITNNFISINGSSGYGIYLNSPNYITIANNSLNIDFTTNSPSTSALYASGGGNNLLYNNSIVGIDSTYLIYVATNSIFNNSNNNNFYKTGGPNFAFWGTNAANLNALKLISTKDSNSVAVNPSYISVSDLHLYSPVLNNIGKVITEVPDDIDGQLRSQSFPDIGADEYTPVPIDLAAIELIEPISTYSQSGVNIPVKMSIRNYGSDSIANFYVVCKFGNATAVSQLYSAYLHVGQIDTITFVNQPVVPGPFEIKVYISLSTDGNHSNDTVKSMYFGIPIKNIPYAENFDNTTEEWFVSEPASIWNRGVPNANVINIAHSTPNVWATNLNGNYINNNTSILYTPIFNNSGYNADTLKFWHWIDAENNKDGGFIEYKNVSGNWEYLGGMNSQDTNATNWYNSILLNKWTGNSAGWQESKYIIGNLSNIGNTVQFRFVFKSDATNNNYNGWAIDDFEITIQPIANDAGVIEIINPVSSLLGDTVYPKVKIKNFGLNTLTSIPVKYSVNGQVIASEVFNTMLAPGSTADYTFSQYFKVTTQPLYTIKAYTVLAGDYYNVADTTIKVVNVSPALKDVGILSIISPADTVYAGSIVTVIVKIKNYGSSAVSSIPVSYKRGSQPAQNDTWTGAALNSGDTATFSFPVTFTVSMGSSFAFSAYTSLVSDAFDLNNKITKSIIISSLPGSSGNITSATIGTYGGDTICFPTGSSSPIIATYTVPVIANATNYIWNYTGSNVTYNNSTSSNSVDLTFNTNSTDGILTVYGKNTLGNGNSSPAFAIDVILNCTIGIEDEFIDKFWLGQNMPNPASGITNIEYNLPEAGEVKFDIITVYGQNIYSISKNTDAGNYLIEFNTKDLPVGIYYYSACFKGKILTRKMLINK